MLNIHNVVFDSGDQW